ncbi:hypothetical protein B0O99DRAFT_125759 [Bisporella sp. PMI_857]|nr:hypothetical protein B0O99DRAFT_125759 [Bisporella sp. PMI_857]
MPEAPPSRIFKIKRRRGACISCKERKIRCNGERPCSTCNRGDLECVYPVSNHKRSNQDLPPLTTSIPNVIVPLTSVESTPKVTLHGRNSKSIDSGIADCCSLPNNDIISLLLEPTLSVSVPELMTRRDMSSKKKL